MIYSTIILGAGAAGLFCGAFSKSSTLIIEGNASPGRKLLLSGGGNCNFSNYNVSAEHYLSQNPHFCRSALTRFPPQKMIDLLNRHGIPWEKREEGKYFAFSARAILDVLTKLNRQNATTFSFATRILAVEKSEDHFRIITSRGEFCGRRVILATGGLSLPKIGATDVGFRLAADFGLAVIPPRPALVELRYPTALRNVFADFAGISFPVEMAIGKRRFRGGLLWTHSGFSGPAALQISLHWRPEAPVFIDFLAETSWNESSFIADSPKNVRISTLLARHMPLRIAQFCCGADDLPLSQISRQRWQRVCCRLRAFEFIPSGIGGYDRAEITAGGIDTRAFSSQTMECHSLPGFHAIGEILDVAGELGGYNLHWAWASANSCNEIS